jgi:hypothetical protein
MCLGCGIVDRNGRWTSARMDACGSTHLLLDQVPTRLAGIPLPRNGVIHFQSAANHPYGAPSAGSNGAAEGPSVHPILWHLRIGATCEDAR